MNCVDAGNVLVHLFLQTSPNYVLTNKKLQYLLIIAQMSGLSRGRVLFEDDIRNFKYGFVLDIIGNSFLTGCAIVDGTAEDAPISRDADSFVLPYSKRKMFEISELPSFEDKRLLIDVFLAFGAYKESTLCALLNGFRVLRKTPAFSVVPKEKISEYVSMVATGNADTGNALFSFVRDQFQASRGVVESPPEKALPETTPLPETKPEPEAELLPEAEPLGEAVKTEVLPAEQQVCPAETGSENVPSGESTAQNEASAEGESVVVHELPQAILSGIPSLQNIVVGKRYSVLAEVRAPGCDCRLSVFALHSNQELPVAREVLSDTLYRFSFDGVASDIKISAMLIR